MLKWDVYRVARKNLRTFVWVLDERTKGRKVEKRHNDGTK